jgi:hypothetical protein
MAASDLAIPCSYDDFAAPPPAAAVPYPAIRIMAETTSATGAESRKTRIMTAVYAATIRPIVCSWCQT